MVTAFPSGENTFVRDHAATGHLTVAFSRNRSDFALNNYIQIRDVTKVAGYYLKITAENCARILDTNIYDFLWPDGHPRPEHNSDTESFTWLQYNTIRRDYGFNLGYLARDQAGWNIEGTEMAFKAQQAMTARTQLVYTQLSNSSNYDTGLSSAVSSITGNVGNWAQSTVARQDIKRSLNYAFQQIQLATCGVVKAKDLVLVMGPGTAKAIAECQELVDHIRHSDLAYAQVRGGLEGARNQQYGLPNQLYGYDVFVDDTVKVTSQVGATRSASFIWATGTACLISRPGGLDAPEAGGPSFSTITMFTMEDMTVETIDDSKNRRVEGHIVDNIVPVVTATNSGFLFSSAA